MKKREIVSQVDPSDLGRGPKREIFHLKKEPVHTERVVSAELEAKRDAEAVRLTEARTIAGRVIKSDNSVDWHKTPEPGPWTGKEVVEDQATEDVLVGSFPKTKPLPKPSFGQKLMAFFKGK